MLVLGFDPSLTNFGWVVHDPDGVSSSRVVERGRFQTPARMTFVDRYLSIRDSVRGLLQRYPGSRVGCESPVFGELYSEGMYGLFLYTNEALRLEKRDVVFLSPGQAKAHARILLCRPKGWKMDKPDMVEAARKDTGGTGRWNHNEADAYWIARTAARFWKLVDGVISVEDLTPTEKAQFTEIHTFQKGKRTGDTVKRGLLFREEERFFLWSEANK